MSSNKIIVLMGSKSDLSFSMRIGQFLRKERFKVEHKYAIASAHRTPELLIKKLKDYEKSQKKIVFITIAGLSDALSGVVAGYSTYPVISCPPDIEKFGLLKAFSSVMMPLGVPVLFTPKPENAAFAALKIFALTDSTIRKQVKDFIEKSAKKVIQEDNEIALQKKDNIQGEHML